MKYGVFGDIHSNLEAFDMTIAALEKEGISNFVCVGDVVGYGADPNACVEKLRQIEPDFVVAGNHDYAAIGKMGAEFFNDFAKKALEWTKEKLSKKNIAFLKKLNLVEETDNFTVVHGTLAEPPSFSYIQTVNEANRSLRKLKTPVCFYGHSHIPISFLKNIKTQYFFEQEIPLKSSKKALVNVGSVGQPRDENPLACYVVYDTDTKTVTIKRADYDILKAGQKIINAGLPSILAERLIEGR